MSDDKPNELRMKRAQKLGDCRHMKAEDLLLDVLREVRELPKGREVRMVMMWVEFDANDPEGPSQWHERSVNVTKSQAIALFQGGVMANSMEYLGLRHE